MSPNIGKQTSTLKKHSWKHRACNYKVLYFCMCEDKCMLRHAHMHVCVLTFSNNLYIYSLPLDWRWECDNRLMDLSERQVSHLWHWTLRSYKNILINREKEKNPTNLPYDFHFILRLIPIFKIIYNLEMKICHTPLRNLGQWCICYGQI